MVDRARCAGGRPVDPLIDFAELARFLDALRAQGIEPAIVPLGTVDGKSKRALVRWREDVWPAGRQADLRASYQARVEGAGILTGHRSGGLVVLDVDYPEGFDTMERLELANGPIPATLAVRSPRKGLHLYLLDPSGRYKTQARQLGLGVDVRGEGGLVACPGSWTPHGIYRMEAP